MRPSTAWANQILDAAVALTGDYTVGISSTVPSLASGVYTGITDVTDVDTPRVAVPAWTAASARSVMPDDDLEFGDATDDFVWAAWVLYLDDVAVIAGRVTLTSVSSGSTVILPAASMPIPLPA